MAGVPAGLPPGIRISDHISLGVIARAFPAERVQQVLADTRQHPLRTVGACNDVLRSLL